MKKKSLLILPVLLLALAACNKEDEVEVPEDDTVTTEPSGDQGTGGTTEGGDEKGDEKEIDKRIALAAKSVYFDGSTVPFTNEADLTSSASADVGGNVTYLVSGTASSMSTSQANEFYYGVAAAGDTYIVATVKLEVDETLSWYSADDPSKQNTLTYEQCNGSEDFIIRISGVTPEGVALQGDPFTFTITGANDEVVSHTLDFSGVSKVPARIAVADGAASLGSEITYENENNLYIASKTMDASGNITYVLGGIASNLTSEQASDIWSGVAAEDDGYIVLTISIKDGETIKWTSPAGDKEENNETADRTGEEDMILRISGTSCYGTDTNKTVVFTITDGQSKAVTHTVDFSNVVIHTHPPVLEETCAPACSLGIFDFAALDSSDASTSHLTTTTGGTILSKAWKEPACAEPTAYEAESSVWTLSAINDYVYPGANGNFTNASNDYWQFSYQCLQFGSNSNNGSLTLDFTGVEVSKVEVTALSWSGSSKLSVDGDAKDITQSALDTTVATPSTYTWDLGTNGINELESETVDSITISATNRVLVFSITIWVTSTAE